MPISPKLTLTLFSTLALLSASCNMKKGGAGDGDLGNCQEAVDHLEQDCDIAFDSSAGSCNAQDECIAGCITASSCEALNGQDSAATAAFEDCAAECTSPGATTTSGTDCHRCADYLDGVASYEELCASSQQLLDGWAACICADTCEIPCFDNACMGFEATEMCGECVLEGCAEQTQACRSDL